MLLWREERAALACCVTLKIKNTFLSIKSGPKKQALHSRLPHNLCAHYDLRSCCWQLLYVCIIHVIREIRLESLESPCLL